MDSNTSKATISLEITGSSVRVSGKIPDEVNNQIIEMCRFQWVGAAWSPQYRMGEWDGFIYLYRWKKFPIGMLHRVKMLLEIWEITYDMVDYRHVGIPHPIPLLLTLRSYQWEIVEEALRRGAGLIQCPTGSGKTVMFIAIMCDLGLPTIVIVPTVDLVDQTLDHWKSDTGMEGIHGDTSWFLDPEREWPDTKWIVSTWQAVSSLIDRTKKLEWKDPSDEKWPCGAVLHGKKKGETKVCGKKFEVKKHEPENKNYHKYEKADLDEMRHAHLEKEKLKKIQRKTVKQCLNQFDIVVADECLTYDQMITLEDGSEMEIGKIVEMKLPARVLSSNLETGEMESKPIVRWIKTPKMKQLVRLTYELEDGTVKELICTEDHKIYMEGAYVMAKDVLEGQEVSTL